MNLGLPLDHLETSLIGAAFLDASIMALVPTAPEEFKSFKAGAVWAACRRLEASGRPIDIVTVENDMLAAGTFDAAGGFSFLGECALRCPTTHNAVEYARQIRDAHLSRRVRLSLSEVLEVGQREGSSGAELLSMAMSALSKLDSDQPDEAQTISQLVKQRSAQLERIASDRANGVKTMTGFPTGIERLDAITGGWQPGTVSIVAARPGMGKSSAAMSTADACSAAGIGVHVFSLEDTRAAYTDRVLSRASTVPAEVIRSCDYANDQFAKISSGMSRMFMRRGWIVDDRSGVPADEIVRAVRRHRRENGTRVVIVDYIQLVQWPRDCKQAHDALTRNVTMLADAAKQDDLAYIVLSQLNRGVESRTDKRPQLQDLRESGSLEERAKCVVGLYRGSYYDDAPRAGIDYDDKSPAPSDAEWKATAQTIVLKNSNGRTGTGYANWDGPTTRMW